MSKMMYRGKQQILFNYLPNRTFDFASIACIARIVNIRGQSRTDLNASVLLQHIADEARAWQEEFRPSLRDDVFRQNDRFVLIDPTYVQSELFPKVLWCQNRNCSAVIDCRTREQLPSQCPRCHQGQLVQLRFVKIHRCGALQPLLPTPCKKCGTASHMYLDTRKSERISNFRWVCRQCNTSVNVYAGNCNECQWPDHSLRGMDIEVHRAGRTFYAHSTVMLNVPNRRFDRLFGIPEWPALAAAKFLGMPEVAQQTLSDYGDNILHHHNNQSTGLSADDLDNLLRRQQMGELTPEELIREMQNLREQRQEEQSANSPSGIVQKLIRHTGVAWPVWKNVGQEILEAVMPFETGNPIELDLNDYDNLNVNIARQMGLSRVALISDYPIITATYGFSRAEYQPNLCRLNPFPAQHEHGGKFPIFVDQTQADALLISLDYNRVLSWLERNGCNPTLPSGENHQLSQRSYFVQLINDVSLRSTITADYREARMVFGLLHTLSHLSIRQAALLCGLDRTSLSEYLLPRTLTFALYCNHRFGATIGALTALFEQSLSEWLKAIKETRRCVYDPMCRDKSGNCHACTHLAETSCRFFNLNLSRAFLFGGYDEVIGNIPVGYFDPSF